MNLNKDLLKSIDDRLNCNGVSIHFSKNFNKDTNYFAINEEIENNNIETGIQGNYLDSYMFLYTFADLLRKNAVSITFNENADKKDIDYLKLLSESSTFNYPGGSNNDNRE